MEPGMPNAFQLLERDMISRVTRGILEGNLVEAMDQLPFDMYPRQSKPHTRCCIYKERAILRYRMLGLLGYRIENEVDEGKPLSAYAREALARPAPLSQPSMTVLDEACKSCVSNKYFVTNACQGCVARPCMQSCPKKAISRVDGQAKIDPDLCVRCGACQRVCPYHAIIKLVQPCEEACPVGAIGKDETGRNKINFEKCIYCGACIGACPFGAVVEPSQIVDVLAAIKQGRKVVAMLAPATLVEFKEAGALPQLFNALKAVGFSDVIEVAVAADKVSAMEANEYLERVVERGDKFMTTSCCPSYWMAVRKHMPAMAPHVSTLGSPMYYAGLSIREADPTALTCFIGPCVAKRAEGLRIPESINFVLTAHETAGILMGARVDVTKMPTTWTPSTLIRRAPSHQGTGFGVAKGVAGAVQAALPLVIEAHNAHLPEGHAPIVAADVMAKLKPVVVSPMDKKAVAQLAAFAAAPAKCPGNLVEVMACNGGCVAGSGAIVLKAIAGAKLVKLSESRPTIADIEELLPGPHPGPVSMEPGSPSTDSAHAHAATANMAAAAASNPAPLPALSPVPVAAPSPVPAQ